MLLEKLTLWSALFITVIDGSDPKTFVKDQRTMKPESLKRAPGPVPPSEKPPAKRTRIFDFESDFGSK